jgi:hypothetical protein
LTPLAAPKSHEGGLAAPKRVRRRAGGFFGFVMGSFWVRFGFVFFKKRNVYEETVGSFRNFNVPSFPNFWFDPL